MSARLIGLIAVIIAFGALSVIALADVGYLGIIEPHFQSWGAGQVFADLVIMCVLGAIWTFHDARTSGVSAWPFFVLTLFAGSFGILFYLVAREVKASAKAPVSA
jgi:hypothetical protein